MSSLDTRAIDEQALPHEPCPAVRHDYRVFLAEEAFDRAVERGTSDTSREVGGVLVGEILRDDAGPYLRIETTVDALHADEKGAELTFTHATWEHIHREMDSHHKGKRVVGWYHTHPGFGVFLSDRDQFIHRSFFDLPFQVALVVDPKAKEHGLFTWRDGEVVRARRYWIGAREQVWDGARSAGAPPDRDAEAGASRAPERTGSAAPAQPHAGDEDGPLWRAAPLVVIAATLLLLGGFGGYWLSSMSANRALVEASVEIAKAKADGAQLALGSLERDLVGILRETLSDQALRRPIAIAVAEVDRATAAIREASPPGQPASPALASLAAVRDNLARLADDRSAAESVLARLEAAARRRDEGGGSGARDAAELRSGLGRLYAELAVDAVKAGDLARARRLLAAAAHLDPGNRGRYVKQLKTFDKSGALPRESDLVGPGDPR
jgi:proteasome lid subunit RPN8/RPN11